MFILKCQATACLFSIFANIICIVVLASLLSQRFNWFLLLQAVCDLIISAVILITQAITLMGVNEHPLAKITDHLCSYVIEISVIFNAIMILLLSIDRLYAIVNPLRSKDSLTSKYPWQLALIILFILLVSNSLQLIFYKKIHEDEYDYQYAEEKAMLDWIKLTVEIVTIVHFVLVLIIAIVSFILNVILLWCINRYTGITRISFERAQSFSSETQGSVTQSFLAIMPANRRSASAQSQKSYRFVIIMISLMDVPIYCYYLYKIFLYYTSKSHSLSYPEYEPEFVSILVKTLYILGRMVNIFIYMLFHREFRAYVFKRLRCKVIDIFLYLPIKIKIDNKQNSNNNKNHVNNQNAAAARIQRPRSSYELNTRSTTQS